ncbi:hypothetical protein PHY01_14430 [Pseudonocardia hydrocarbonoxydans]|uniref:Uncharacterized protein n=1 Tax=Pseudonocardia hydrocarbonoxydans TaxID=76726 RepID=A0A4Y3WM72_9PSEU|nr:hypothetical protein PHY01_14430 [Pseudonocardia hydrocarbonoxydans]
MDDSTGPGCNGSPAPTGGWPPCTHRVPSPLTAAPYGREVTRAGAPG